MAVSPTIRIPARIETMIVEIRMNVEGGVPIVQIGVPAVVCPGIMYAVVSPTTKIPAMT
jgi:hypothetical protein